MCKLWNEKERVATEGKGFICVLLLKGAKCCSQSSAGWLSRIHQGFIPPTSLEKFELAEETDLMVIITSFHYSILAARGYCPYLRVGAESKKALKSEIIARYYM